MFDAPPGLLRAAPRRWPRGHAAIGAPAGVFLVVVLVVGAAGAQGLHPVERGTPPTGGPGTSAAVSRAADPMLQVAYDQPPPTPDPTAPGTSISSGPDETDPFMVVEDGHYYLFTSRSGPGPNVPVRSATVLGRWGPATDALPQLPAWAAPGWAWAPDVRRFGDRYVLYFTTLLRGSSPPTMCIGDAVATDVNGPFEAEPAPWSARPRWTGPSTPAPSSTPTGSRICSGSRIRTPCPTPPTPRSTASRSARTGFTCSANPEWSSHQTSPGRATSWKLRTWWRSTASTTSSTRATGSTNPATPSAWPSATARSARAPTPRRRRCWDRTPRAPGPVRSRCSAMPRASGCSTRPFHSAVPLSGPPRPSTIAHLGFGSSGVYLAETPADPASA